MVVFIFIFNFWINSLNSNLTNCLNTHTISGAHNLLKYGFSGTRTFSGGATLTDNEDYTYTINGTQSSRNSAILVDSNRSWTYTDVDWLNELRGQNLILSGGVTGASIALSVTDVNGTSTAYTTEYSGGSKEFTLTTEEIASYTVYTCVTEKTYSNAVLYPMLRLASDEDSTWAAPTYTSRQIYENLTNLYTVTRTDITSDDMILSGCTVQAESCSISNGNMTIVRGYILLPDTITGGWTDFLQLPYAAQITARPFVRIAASRVGGSDFLTRDAAINTTGLMKVYISSADAGKYLIMDDIVYFNA